MEDTYVFFKKTSILFLMDVHHKNKFQLFDRCPFLKKSFHIYDRFFFNWYSKEQFVFHISNVSRGF